MFKLSIYSKDNIECYSCSVCIDLYSCKGLFPASLCTIMMMCASQAYTDMEMIKSGTGTLTNG